MTKTEGRHVIRSLSLIAALSLPGLASAEEAKTESTQLERHRTPFEALTERMIGSASRAVRFDWRQKTVTLGIATGSLLELNSFASMRIGAFARVPVGNLLVEFAFSRAITWGSDSTANLARTPYRQIARPGRFEIDLNLEFPLAEGVVTPRFGFIPPAEMVFSLAAGFRYLLYTEIWKDLTVGEAALAIVSPSMSEKELNNLEGNRLPAMKIDPSRYALLAGFSVDLYFQPGFLLSPRVMLALPVFSAGDRNLGAWWELTLRVGWAL